MRLLINKPLLSHCCSKKYGFASDFLQWKWLPASEPHATCAWNMQGKYYLLILWMSFFLGFLRRNLWFSVYWHRVHWVQRSIMVRSSTTKQSLRIRPKNTPKDKTYPYLVLWQSIPPDGGDAGGGGENWASISPIELTVLSARWLSSASNLTFLLGWSVDSLLVSSSSHNDLFDDLEPLSSEMLSVPLLEFNEREQSAMVWSLLSVLPLPLSTLTIWAASPELDAGSFLGDSGRLEVPLVVNGVGFIQLNSAIIFSVCWVSCTERSVSEAVDNFL